MLQITLTKVVKFAITMEEQLPMRQKNITKYHKTNSNSEKLDEKDEEDHHKPKRKDIKVQFDTIRRGVYCQNCYNERHFTT